MICTLILLVLTLILSAILFQTCHQIKNINMVLDDISNGNMDRRIVTSRQSLLADTCYKINSIMAANKERLVQAERETRQNDKIMTSLSHDIRTPLTSIIGYLDAVHYQYVRGETSVKYIETAKEKAYLLKKYIDELFEWFKINSKDETADLESSDIIEETRITYANWIEIFEKRSIAYDLITEKEELYAMIDKVFFSRILNNLIKNALDHSDGTKIWIEISETKNSVLIEVNDNGKGIPAQDTPYIFERLYKANTARNNSGSGLGLTITKALVILQGGKISVHSSISDGTHFILEFPKS